jgi:hypothetical protein
MVKLKVRGIPQTIKKLNKDYNSEKEAIVARKLNEIVNTLQENTPVDTGYAASRWSYTKTSIVNDAGYISDLNRGSSIQAPLNFVERSILSHDGAKPSGNIVRYI